MAIGKLVFTGNLENGFIGASCVYFADDSPITDAHIPISSPYTAEDGDDISNDIDGPFLGGHNSLRPTIIMNGSFFNGWTAMGPFATDSLADEFGSRYLEGSDNDENTWGLESPVARYVRSVGNETPYSVEEILAHRDELLNATIVLPYREFDGNDGRMPEAPTPAYCRLYFSQEEGQGPSVFFEGVLPDGETDVGGELTDDLLAQAHMWQGQADYMEQTPYIVSGNQAWDELMDFAQANKKSDQDRP